MVDFNFIINSEYRKCLEGDYAELQACLKTDAKKAVVVLAGSIVEAVLTDALVGAQLTVPGTLEKIIEEAQANKFLDEDAVHLSTVIRRFRNLIHPSLSVRRKENVGANEAIIAAQVVEIVAKQVAKRKQETYGFTAEQLLDRLKGGPSAFSLLSHLVKKTPEGEIERFLTGTLPAAFFAATSDKASRINDVVHLAECYRRVFAFASDDIRRKVVKRIHDIYVSGDESTVLTYETWFVKGSDLQYLDPSERQVIKDHLLARVDRETIANLFGVLQGIGRFLDVDEAGILVMHTASVILEGDPASVRQMTLFILSEYGTMESACRSQARDVAVAMEAAKLLKSFEDRETRIKP